MERSSGGSPSTLLIQRARPGDFLESLPLLDRAASSGGPLGLLCSPEIASWARALEIKARVLTLPGVHPEEGFSGGYPKWRALVGELRDGHWERVVHLNHDRGGVALVRASAIPVGYGFTRMAGETEGEPDSPLGWPAYLVSSARGLRRKNRIHLSDIWREFLPEGPVTESSSPRAFGGSVVLVLSGRSLYRQPTFETLEALIRGLRKNGVGEVILLGRPDEAALGESLSRLFLGSVRNLAGKTSIADLDALVRDACLVISPDTAPLHLASFRRIPTIGLFFGGASPHETGARYGRRISIVSRMACHPCGAEGSGCQTIACRDLMDGSMIAEVAVSVMSGGPLPSSTPSLWVYEGGESDGGFNRLILSGEPLRVSSGSEGEEELLGILFRRFFLRLLGGTGQPDPVAQALSGVVLPVESLPVLEHLETGVRLMAALATSSLTRRIAAVNEFPVLWPLAHHLWLDGSGSMAKDAFSELTGEIQELRDTVRKRPVKTEGGVHVG